MEINLANTAFLIMCSALVFLMTPALALFYAGMERRKNVLNTMMSCFFICGIGSLLWIAIGYSLAFGTDHGGVIGSLSNVFFNGVGAEPIPIHKKSTVLGAATGAVVGLVAITPGAGFVPIWASIIIGALVSPICFFTMTKVKSFFKYDDALDAFGCHGIGGIWGGIATGIFAKKSINSAAQWDGLFFGDTHLFVAQVISIVITIAFAAIATFLILTVMKLFMPIRVASTEEAQGLDLSEHGEMAYPAFNGLD